VGVGRLADGLVIRRSGSTASVPQVGAGLAPIDSR